MIILKVDVVNVAIVTEAEDDAPVSGDLDAPEAVPVAVQRVESVHAVQVARVLSDVEGVEHRSDFREVAGRQPPCIAAPAVTLQASMSEGADGH